MRSRGRAAATAAGRCRRCCGSGRNSDKEKRAGD
jgi:hypothetical protein